MADDAHLAAEDHEIAEFRAPRNTGLGHDNAMPSDHHVVPDLDEIINFAALPDHGIAQGAPVDGGIGADFYPVLDDDPADLRHFQVSGLAHGEAEPVLADGDPGVKGHLVADQRMGDGGIGADVGVP